MLCCFGLALSACSVTTPSHSPKLDQVKSADSTGPISAPLTCPEVKQCRCPIVKQRRCPVSPAAKIADKLVIGGVEKVHFDPPGLMFMARIDTGAAGTSIHARNITPFERDGQNWVRFEIDHPSVESSIVIERPLARIVRVKQSSMETPERRQVIKMTLTLGPLSEQIEVSLSERSLMKYPALIGRNFLKNLAIVDVSQQLVVK